MRSLAVSSAKYNRIRRAEGARDAYIPPELSLEFLGPQDLVEIKAAGEKARTDIDSMAIQLSDFSEATGHRPVDIRRNAAYAESMQQRFAQERTTTLERIEDMAAVMEVVFGTNIDGSEWIPRSDVIFTSKYDDIVNGVDMVVEMPDRKGTPIMGLDITLASSDVVEKKVNRVIHNIRDGKLATVDYYRSENFTDTKLNYLPLFIAGVDIHAAAELSQLYTNGKRGEITDHVASIYMLYELRMQAEAYMKAAEGYGRGHIADYMNTFVAMTNTLIEERGGNANPTREEYEALAQNDMMFDAMYKTLKTYLE